MSFVELKEDNQFNEFVKGTGVIQFSAAWCGPCKRLKPTLTSACKERNLPLLYVDVDEFSELADQYRVQKLPTVMIVKTAQELARFEGSNLEQIVCKMDELLK